MEYSGGLIVNFGEDIRFVVHITGQEITPGTDKILFVIRNAQESVIYFSVSNVVAAPPIDETSTDINLDYEFPVNIPHSFVEQNLPPAGYKWGYSIYRNPTLDESGIPIDGADVIVPVQGLPLTIRQAVSREEGVV